MKRLTLFLTTLFSILLFLNSCMNPRLTQIEVHQDYKVAGWNCSHGNIDVCNSTKDPQVIQIESTDSLIAYSATLMLPFGTEDCIKVPHGEYKFTMSDGRVWIRTVHPCRIRNVVIY